MSKKEKIFNIMHGKLPAYSLAEVLIVMIVSGIVFLTIFEGLDIIRRYSRMINRKLTAKSALIESHLSLMSLMEQTDSIRLEGNELIFYSNTPDTTTSRMTIEDTNLLLHKSNMVERLFEGMTDLGFTSISADKKLVDSVFIAVVSGKDSLRFEYGLPILVDIKIK